MIVLRKALGADVNHTASREALSAIRFHTRHIQSSTVHGVGSIPGGFAAHLVSIIGGRSIELDEECETPSQVTEPGKKVDASWMTPSENKATNTDSAV